MLDFGVKFCWIWKKNILALGTESWSANYPLKPALIIITDVCMLDSRS